MKKEEKKKKITERFVISPSLNLLLCLFIFSISTSISVVLADEEISIATHPTTLLLSSGRAVENSPGSKPGTLMVCERIHIRGQPRLQNLGKYAHSLKVKVNITQTSSRAHPRNVDVCFHRNASLQIGMCPQNEWEKLGKGLWVRYMSPYDNKLLDIRMPGRSIEFVEVSTEEEFRLYRVIFLVLGIVMMTLAPALSKSVIFYYSSAMTVGIVLVILMVLFQGMKLLPTGRKSSLAIFMYSSIVGVGSFLLSYLSGLLRSVLVQIGISEDIYSPVAIFLLVSLVLAGAWLGFWGVRKLILTEDGSVDISVAQDFCRCYDSSEFSGCPTGNRSIGFWNNCLINNKEDWKLKIFTSLVQLGISSSVACQGTYRNIQDNSSILGLPFLFTFPFIFILWLQISVPHQKNVKLAMQHACMKDTSCSVCHA